MTSLSISFLDHACTRLHHHVLLGVLIVVAFSVAAPRSTTVAAALLRHPPWGLAYCRPSLRRSGRPCCDGAGGGRVASFSTTIAFSRRIIPRSTSTSSSTALNAGKGFQQKRQQPQQEEEKSTPKDDIIDKDKKKKSQESIYSKPALYDLAFGYRDYEAQVEFLLEQHAKHSTSSTRSTITSDENDNNNKKKNANGGLSILFLGAGPARHALIALQDYPEKVSGVTCIDTSSEMLAYAKELAAAHEGLLHVEDQVGFFKYITADMRDFVPHPEFENSNNKLFDTSWILMGSLQHLTSNSDVLECFHNVATTLKPGGTLILELPHPKEELLGGMVDCTTNDWKVPLEDDQGNDDAGQLNIVWGDENDEFDAITQIRNLTVSLELTETTTATTSSSSKKRGKPQKKSATEVVQSVRQVIPIRLFTAQEIDALARCAGFQVVSMSGALEEDISIHDDAAYRLVCILRKL